MNFQDRLSAICARMRDEKLALLIGLHDGAHFIEKPNPVMVLTGFKAVGASAAVLYRDGSTALIVAPAWDAERAAQACPHAHVIGADDVVEGLFALIGRDWSFADDVGMAGLAFLPSGIAARVTATPRHARRARLVRRRPLRYEHVPVGPVRRAPASFGEIQPNRVPVTDHQPVGDGRTRTACGGHDGEATRREKACAGAEIDSAYRVAASGDEQRGAVSAACEREGPHREQHGWRDPRHVVPYTARHGGD